MSQTRMRVLLAAAALLWLAPVAGAAAQTQSDTIVVTGRTPEATQRFVQQVSAVPDSADQLARWDREICVSIAGLPARQGQFLADRIAQRAFALGLQPGAPGCQGNVAVFVTNDSDAMARQLFEQDQNLFAYRQEDNVTTLGQEAFQGFLSSQKPVRWWHVAQTVGADGIALNGDASVGGMENAPMVRSRGSRLSDDTRQDMMRAIIIVDARRVGNVQLAALGDYIAMVALAQVDANADTTGFPTILNLFSGGANAPTAMTDWDTSFLDGLYSATRAAANAQQQEREIARRMQARNGGQGQP